MAGRKDVPKEKKLPDPNPPGLTEKKAKIRQHRIDRGDYAPKQPKEPPTPWDWLLGK